MTLLPMASPLSLGIPCPTEPRIVRPNGLAVELAGPPLVREVPPNKRWKLTRREGACKCRLTVRSIVTESCFAP